MPRHYKCLVVNKKHQLTSLSLFPLFLFAHHSLRLRLRLLFAAYNQKTDEVLVRVWILVKVIVWSFSFSLSKLFFFLCCWWWWWRCKKWVHTCMDKHFPGTFPSFDTTLLQTFSNLIHGLVCQSLYTKHLHPFLCVCTFFNNFIFISIRWCDTTQRTSRE